MYVKGRRMAVYGLFKNKAFEPEAIVAMTRAHAEVCRALGLGGLYHSADDAAAKDAIAKKVIEFAQRGERDAARLRENVLQALRTEPELTGPQFRT